MAYSNIINPYGYYGNIYQPNLWQQQMLQQPQTQYDIPIEGVIFLSSEDAKLYKVPPHKRVLIMDRDKSIFYIKSADALGQIITSPYKFEPLEENETDDTKSEETNVSAFVNTEDFESFKQEINKSIDDLKKSLIKDNE